MSKHGEQCTVVLRSRAGRCRHREAIAAGISGDATQTETGVSADYETATDGDRSRTPMEGNNIYNARGARCPLGEVGGG